MIDDREYLIIHDSRLDPFFSMTSFDLAHDGSVCSVARQYI